MKKLGGYKIIADGLGFPDIKIGDKFEGAACGHFFTNQICTSINDEFIGGTTTLVSFTKSMIRPIKEPLPYVQTFGEMSKYEEEINKVIHK